LGSDRKKNPGTGDEGYRTMSRKTAVTLLIAIAAALLAIGLFIAGAIWRAAHFETDNVESIGKVLSPCKQ
jgi:hypothetical protein